MANGKNRITVELDDDTYLRVRILCATKKVSMSVYIAHILREEIVSENIGKLVAQALKKPKKKKEEEGEDIPGQLTLDISAKAGSPKKGKKGKKR